MILLLLGHSPNIQAFPSHIDEGSEQYFNYSNVPKYTDDLQLQSDVYYHFLAKLKGEIVLTQKQIQKSPQAVIGELSSSLFLSSMFSMHGELSGSWLKAEQKIWSRNQSSDVLVAQIGGLGYSPLRFVLGRAELPIGIRDPIIKGWYQSQLKYNLYQTPRQSMLLTWDNRKNFLFDVGYASGVIERNGVTSNENGLMIRVIYDFAILGSTRSIASFYGEESLLRRWSIGFLTVGDEGDETHLDFVRELTTPDGKSEPFKQNIRFGYRGATKMDSRWLFELNDELNSVTIGAIAYEFKLVKYLWGSAGFAVERSVAENQNNSFSILTGLGTQI